MKRLTYWCPDGKGGGEWRANVRGTEVKGEEIDRLAAYEDTGLEPEKIEAINGSEVAADLRKTVKLLHKVYETAKQAPFVRDPLAYAVYQVWKATERRARP